MGHRIAGRWFPEPGDFQHRGLWYPDGEEITKHMDERLACEPFYQAGKLAQAIAVLRARLGEGPWRGAIDCGTWVGAWTRALCERFREVLAIDLAESNCRCVRRNAPRATVVCAALGERSGMAHRRKSDFDSHVSWQVGGAQGGHGEAVAQHALDEMPEVRAMAAIDYLKIHVNGYEVKALAGAKATIRRHQPVITIVLKPALADFGDTPGRAHEMLTSLGYAPAGGEKPYEIWAPAARPAPRVLGY